MCVVAFEAERVEKVWRPIEIFKSENSASEYARSVALIISVQCDLSVFLFKMELLTSFPIKVRRERLVSALARVLKVPLLKLDDEHGWDYWDEKRDVQNDANDDNRVPALKIGSNIHFYRGNFKI